MAEYLKYFKSQLHAGDPNTIVYWCERYDGENFDIHPSDIPNGALVTDVTYDKHPVEFRFIEASDGW